ncbi:uncharacterized protein [Spinacia oleracea]|uniref:Reverse transcriptase zinc-binding domain-containing protein n=1 Tax=Spinacia oleracea TaxID=3562 RepID=A0ABM3RIM8_SPIOL|nr:uncharacterized protein LOC130469929 [Spinacia oleracea]
MTHYSVKQVYGKLTGDKPHIQWDKVVWNRLNVPKHMFICWLAMQGRLQTTANLAKLGISTSAECLICKQGDEVHEHLLFNCQYSLLCLQGVATLVYLIWKSRNQSFWENSVPAVHSVMGSLKHIVRDRITVVMSQKLVVF